jgi:3-hydroxybutyryl-CoA dehydratase
MKFTVQQSDIDQYGRLNGDRDIIHYDASYAAKRGFRGPLAHGLMVQGFANAIAMDVFGDSWVERGSISVKFIGPVHAGDTIDVNVFDDGTVEATGPDGTTMVGSARLRDV